MVRKREPVVGEAEPAEGTIAPAEMEEQVVVDLDQFEPHRAPVEESKRVDFKIAEAAQEVMEGKWGVGQDRRTRLAKAGYDVKAVEKEVLRRLNP